MNNSIKRQYCTLSTKVRITLTSLLILMTPNAWAQQSWGIGSTEWNHDGGTINLITRLRSSSDDNASISRQQCNNSTVIMGEQAEDSISCPSWLDGHSFLQVEPFKAQPKTLTIEGVLEEVVSDGVNLILEREHCIISVLGHYPEGVSPSIFANFLSPEAQNLQTDSTSICTDSNTNTGQGYPTTSGYTEQPEFEFVKADNPGWIEYVILLSSTDEKETIFTGTPNCAPDTLESIGDWLIHDGYTITENQGGLVVTTPSPFECISFKIPMTTEKQTPGTIQPDEMQGMTSTLNLDGAFSNLGINELNDNWYAQIGVRPGTDQHGVGCDLESTCECSDSLCLNEFFSAVDFKLAAQTNGSEDDSMSYTSVQYPSDFVASDCGLDQPDDIYYLQLIGKDDYAGLDLSAPLLLDWDGDSFESEPTALCDLISDPGFDCNALDCNDSCNLEACMACQLDCTRTDWDCDDSNPNTYIGAEEICDGQDNDCDGITDESLNIVYADRDNDGFGTGEAASCNESDESLHYVQVSGDCDDNSAMIYPGAPNYLLQDTVTGLIFDNDCVAGLEPWQEALRDSDHDGYPESLVVDVQHPLGLQAVVELMAETHEAVESLGLPNSNTTVMNALFLSPGDYPAALVIGGFQLELRAEPGTVNLFPSALSCEAECLSILIAYDNADVLIDGLSFEQGWGTSDSLVAGFLTPKAESTTEEDPDVLLRESSSETGTEAYQGDLHPTPTDFHDVTEYWPTLVPKVPSDDDSPTAKTPSESTLEILTPTPLSTPSPGGDETSDTDSTQPILQYCSSMTAYVDDLRWGGAILASNSRLIIKNSTFNHNQAHMGAAITLMGSEYASSISNSIFDNNVVLDPMWSNLAPILGTIYVEGASLDLFDNVLSNNTLSSVPEFNPVTGLFEPLELDCIPHFGAALGIYYGSITAANNLFFNNIGDYGSAISLLGVSNSNSLNFYNNTIDNNLSFLGGGALAALTIGISDEPTLRFQNNILSGNRSYGIAGGGFIMGSHSTFRNNLVSANIGTSYGGLLFIGTEAQTLEYLTFDRNHSMSQEVVGVEAKTLSDLSMFPIEYVLDSIESDIMLEEEIASTLRLLWDVETGKHQLPTHAMDSTQAQAQALTEDDWDIPTVIEGSYHVSHSVLTPVATIELARSCGHNIDYTQMLWLPSTSYESFECDQSEAWLRLQANPYQVYSQNPNWSANDYHLSELVPLAIEGDFEPEMGNVEDYNIEDLGVYGGPRAAREAGAFHSKCLDLGEGFVAHLPSTTSLEGELSNFDSLITGLDGSPKRQDAYAIYLNAGERLSLNISSNYFTPSTMILGPEALSFDANDLGQCDLSDAQFGFQGQLDIVAEKSGYYSLFVGSDESSGLGPYSLSMGL